MNKRSILLGLIQCFSMFLREIKEKRFLKVSPVSTSITSKDRSQRFSSLSSEATFFKQRISLSGDIRVCARYVQSIPGHQRGTFPNLCFNQRPEDYSAHEGVSPEVKSRRLPPWYETKTSLSVHQFPQYLFRLKMRHLTI